VAAAGLAGCVAVDTLAVSAEPTEHLARAISVAGVLAVETGNSECKRRHRGLGVAMEETTADEGAAEESVAVTAHVASAGGMGGGVVVEVAMMAVETGMVKAAMGAIGATTGAMEEEMSGAKEGAKAGATAAAMQGEGGGEAESTAAIQGGGEAASVDSAFGSTVVPLHTSLFDGSTRNFVHRRSHRSQNRRRRNSLGKNSVGPNCHMLFCISIHRP